MKRPPHHRRKPDQPALFDTATEPPGAYGGPAAAAGLRLCRWPGCTVMVAARLWGCRVHWFMLPRAIRNHIWAAYRPGQEQDLRLSGAYIDAEQAAQDWIAAQPARTGPDPRAADLAAAEEGAEQ